ncbi:hypothetical protein Y032_0133g1779 [Ancylostoma ceylanicum]|uniref:Uncharacterized protein n=2 Tax=Ancylostoma ceylanicum TaxID=53326 RepID=A0A016T669_9BILA|nr:hypothetical protein Y032_0133g1779 [Ancylostoma ceylanicum]
MRLQPALLLVVGILNQICLTGSMKKGEKSGEKNTEKPRMLKTSLRYTSSLESSPEEGMHSLPPRKLPSMKPIAPNAQKFHGGESGGDIDDSSSTTAPNLQRKHEYSAEPEDISVKDPDLNDTTVTGFDNENGTNVTAVTGTGIGNASMFEITGNSTSKPLEELMQNSGGTSGGSTVNSGTTPELDETTFPPESFDVTDQESDKNGTTTDFDPLSFTDTEEATFPSEPFEIYNQTFDHSFENSTAGLSFLDNSTMESSTRRNAKKIPKKPETNGTEPPSDDLTGQQFETTIVTTKSLEDVVGGSSTATGKIAGGKLHRLLHGGTSTEAYSTHSGSFSPETTENPDENGPNLEDLMGKDQNSTNADTSAQTDVTATDEFIIESTSGTHDPEDEHHSGSPHEPSSTHGTSGDDIVHEATTTSADLHSASDDLNTRPTSEHGTSSGSSQHPHATGTTDEDHIPQKLPTIPADQSSTPDDGLNVTAAEHSTSEDIEQTSPHTAQTTKTKYPSGTLFPKPPQHRNKTDYNGTAEHLRFYRGNMDDILLTIALIGVCVLLVVLIIICLGIRNEKKHVQMRKDMRQEMLDEERFFKDYGQPPPMLPTPPKQRPPPPRPREEFAAPKEKKVRVSSWNYNRVNYQIVQYRPNTNRTNLIKSINIIQKIQFPDFCMRITSTR